MVRSTGGVGPRARPCVRGNRPGRNQACRSNGKNEDSGDEEFESFRRKFGAMGMAGRPRRGFLATGPATVIVNPAYQSKAPRGRSV